jgi:hypothetical protein
MEHKSLGLIARIGADTSRPKFPQLATTNATDFAIEVQMLTGEQTFLELSQGTPARNAMEYVDEMFRLRGLRLGVREAIPIGRGRAHGPALAAAPARHARAAMPATTVRIVPHDRI